jgi:hypothetical protein
MRVQVTRVVAAVTRMNLMHMKKCQRERMGKRERKRRRKRVVDLVRIDKNEIQASPWFPVIKNLF